MKICVTSQGGGLDAAVDPRFGRCQYFIIVDTGTLEFEAVQNPNLSAAGGAGIQSGQLVADKGAQALVSGDVGPNAFRTLQAAGVEVMTGASGTVRDVIEKYKRGGFQAKQGPTVTSKHGTAK